MTHFRYSVSLIIILALTVVFIGCAKPPEAEKAAAKAAADAAVSSGADKYATADLNKARQAWEAAETFMKEKKYEEARQGYLSARAAFEKTAGAVGEGKKRAAAEAQAAVAALEGSWVSLKSGIKMDNKDKNKKDAWEEDVKTFTESLQKIKDMIARDPAGAKGKVEELKSIIVKWDAAKPAQKATAEPPAKTPPAAVSPAEQKTKVVGNRDSKLYHLPGMKYYNAVKAYHRVKFDSEEEAIKAGYHKAPR